MNAEEKKGQACRRATQPCRRRLTGMTGASEPGIYPIGGKSHLLQPLAIANALRIPTSLSSDSDAADWTSTSRK